MLKSVQILTFVCVCVTRSMSYSLSVCLTRVCARLKLFVYTNISQPHIKFLECEAAMVMHCELGWIWDDVLLVVVACLVPIAAGTEKN